MNTFIIAEAGVNHNGSLKLAKKLIDVASKAGANAVKFQTFKTNKLVTKKSKKAKYQKKLSNKSESQYEMLKRYELSKNDHKELIKYCNLKKITFLSSPFDHESIDLLDSLGINTFKIPSGELTNLPYLRHIGRLNKKIILSTGMSYLSEVSSAVNVLTTSGTKKSNITILHANTEYPTPIEHANLNAMVNMGENLGLKYGYSDHTKGIEICIAACALGARCIEKHFTIDKNLEGPDHNASLDPVELFNMVKMIRKIELALGDGIKQPSKSERKNIKIIRKSIVAKKAIKLGEIFSEKNISVKRPGNGISPMEWDNIIGTRARKEYKEDDLI